MKLPNYFYKRIFPLPLALYLIGIFALALLLFVAIGIWTQIQINEVERLENENRRHAAHAEVVAAMENTLKAMRNHATKLAQWPESQQQLSDPTYYEYWRNNRALSASGLPDYIEAADLYDAGGERLGGEVVFPLMPEELSTSHFYMRGSESGAWLLLFTPIVEEAGGGALLGYAGIAADLHQALLAESKFTYADPEKFEVTLPVGEAQPINRAVNFLKIEPRESFQLHPIEEIIGNTTERILIAGLVLLIAASVLASRLFHLPLRNLTRHINNLRSGNVSLYEKADQRPMCVTELETLRTSLNDYQRELESMNANLDQKNRELWQLAHRDPMTGVSNRRAYDEEWHQLQELVRGQRFDVSVLLIDCDHFKAINDSYGHEVGDRVIKLVAEALKEAVRDNDRLYRLGGDEFAIHLLNRDAEAAEQVAIRCQYVLAHTDFRQIGIREPVRFSIGIAHARGDKPGELMKLHRQADIAMYQAKRPGHNKIVRYRPEMRGNGPLLSNRFINAIYQVIESGQGLKLHYQPVMSLVPSQVGFYEVLTRIVDDKGLITPANIFPVVEAEGLGAELDFAIIRTLAGHLEDGYLPADCCISLNLDGTTLMHERFLEQIQVLQQYVCNGGSSCKSCIILEITETTLISDLEEVTRRLQELRQLGFKVALDDFGSGYSSLRYLSTMPVDIVKFDAGLVHDLLGHRSQRTVAESTATMILQAGYKLVAEGIENDEQLERVQSLGFTHAQGFLLGVPRDSIDPKFRLRLMRSPANAQLH